MYVLVSTFFEFTGDALQREVGAVYGPYETKAEAELVRAAHDFPRPEWVFIREVHNAGL